MRPARTPYLCHRNSTASRCTPTRKKSSTGRSSQRYNADPTGARRRRRTATVTDSHVGMQQPDSTPNHPWSIRCQRLKLPVQTTFSGVANGSKR
ncbi:MAG: hypothetical protein LBL97_05520 [Prevotellaceae bacterium]|nr:hypothetical protein [Prevotellaceae bacterium]